MTDPRAPFDATDPFDQATEDLRGRIVQVVIDHIEQSKPFAALDDHKKIESLLVSIGVSLCCSLLCEMQDTEDNQKIIETSVTAMLPFWMDHARDIAGTRGGAFLQ